MRTFVRLLGSGLLLLAATFYVFPQEGHPLSGTWTGDAGPSATARQHLTIVLNWNGQAVTGLINPGPDAGTLRAVVLDPATWTVRLEGDLKDSSGRAAAFSGEGKLENLGSIHRTIKGTWKHGTASGDFRLVRD
jgi:hypothetical protein